MQNTLKQLKRGHIALIILAVSILSIAYYQYQAYETERKLDIERKEIGQRMRDEGKRLAEEMRKHPLVIPIDPLAPSENPLGAIPSDAEEMAQIKLWHQSSPEQRNKLLPVPEKLPTQLPEQMLKEQIEQTQSEQLSDAPETNPLQIQALQAIQQLALAAKSKQN